MAIWKNKYITINLIAMTNFSHEVGRRPYVPHYYGDVVRVMFMIAGVVMLITFPFFNEIVAVPTLLSSLIIIALALVAGLMNPKQKWVLILNVIVSVAAFMLLEYHAYYAFSHLDSLIPLHATFFWVSQILALLFFFATYLSVKTVRGRYVKDLQEGE